METEEKVNILLVDDRPENLLALEAILSDLGQNLVKAHSGEEALKCLLKEDFALILLDVQMPGMDGFETAALIRERERSQHIPIIFLTAIGKSDLHVLRGYSVGAVDYLFKPIVPEILRSKVMVFVELFKMTQRLAHAELTMRRQNETLEQRVAERTAELEAKSEEIRSMSQQLWQTAKLATMGELAASIAHELNNPLATVSLHVESLLAQIPADDPRRRGLEVIEQEVGRMGNLVANLLQFSRRSHPQISTVDVRVEIENSLDLIHYRLRKHHITIVRDFAPEVPMVYADRQQLRQLFLNLCSNAMDAMREQGGVLTIRVSLNGRENEGTGEERAEQVIIEISDIGEGISPEDLPKVMEPFFTTKPEGQGTGLGLPICRRVVQEHGGTLDLLSEGIPGKGTTARIVLPVPGIGNGKLLEEA